MKTKLGYLAALLSLLAAATANLPVHSDAAAQQAAAVAISVKGHRFLPGEVRAPANRPLAITIRNLDATPMEFESVSLRVEKVIAAGGSGTVHVRPLAPGKYEFFDDFHQDTRGNLIVR